MSLSTSTLRSQDKNEESLTVQVGGESWGVCKEMLPAIIRREARWREGQDPGRVGLVHILHDVIGEVTLRL